MHNRISFLSSQTGVRFVMKAFGFAISCIVGICGAVAADEYPDPRPITGAEDQYALVQRDTGTGVVSAAGEVLIKPIYRQIDYVGSRRFVGKEKFGDEVLYLLDEHGKRLARLDLRAQSSEPFHDGILRIGFDENLSYVNLRGDFIIKSGVYSYGGNFCEGLASVYLLNAKVHTGAYINKSGRIALGPYSDCDCMPFRNGCAIVSNTRTGKGGVINKSGKYILPADYEDLFSADGLHFFGRKDGRSLLLSKKNRTLAVFPENCLSARLPDSLSETSLIACSFAVPSDKAGEEPKTIWGYCDVQGKIVIAPRYDGAGWNEVDFFTVYMNDVDGAPVSGMIDRQGNWIRKPVFLEDESTERLVEKWKLATPERRRIFAELLKRYDLIGMKVSDLVSILGQGVDDGEHNYFYNLTPGANCAYISEKLQFEISDGRVQKWRVVSVSAPHRANSDGSDWVTFNAVKKEVKAGLRSDNLLLKKPSASNQAGLGAKSAERY